MLDIIHTKQRNKSNYITKRDSSKACKPLFSPFSICATQWPWKPLTKELKNKEQYNSAKVNVKSKQLQRLYLKWKINQNGK